MQVTLLNTLSPALRSAAKFINSQEQASGLSTTRFIQDTGTSLLPKAVFARSKADLAENSFLELSESMLVYFAPALIGEKVARNIFSRNLSKSEKPLVAESAVNLMKMNNTAAKKVLPVKAAIALTSLIIPLTEFTLNYFKNLFTLKVFKKGDFNSIANLNSDKEDSEKQKKVRKSAEKNIKRAAGVYGLLLAMAGLLASKGSKSKVLQNFSELILAPGSKLFKNNKKASAFLDKYASIDFSSQDGKLVLSRGQLTSCVVIGGVGYFGAAKDRGKQNFLETLYRYPLVGFYIITGSDLFEKGFKKLLVKSNKCKEIIGKDLKTPSFDELGDIAAGLAKKNGTSVEAEFAKLVKQKALIFGVPFLFSMGVMGFFVAGISNLFTKYRYKREVSQNKQ